MCLLTMANAVNKHKPRPPPSQSIHGNQVGGANVQSALIIFEVKISPLAVQPEVCVDTFVDGFIEAKFRRRRLTSNMWCRRRRSDASHANIPAGIPENKQHPPVSERSVSTDLHQASLYSCRRKLLKAS